MMKNWKQILTAGLLLTIFMAGCQQKTETTTDNIAPSAGDETRYNLSEQQEMSMQGDTLKNDSTALDSLE